MFVYATPSYPTYSPPTLYPHAHYVTVPSIPTARERYLQAVAEAQAARARYISELEEQRILARLRQQEALRQAEYRQRQIVVAQNELTRRRLGRMYAENMCRPVAVPHGRRPAFVRQQRSFCPTDKPQSSLNDLEALLSVLLGDRVDEQVKHQDEKSSNEETEMPNVSDAKAGYFNKLEAALKAATQVDRDIHKCQHFRHSGQVPRSAPASNPAQVPLTRQAGVPRNYFIRDRAARAIQRRWRSRSADAAARHDAVATIATLRARFQFLRDTFSFPEHLEFKAQEEGDTTTPTLLFTSANTAVHTYIHELTKLLTLADAVSSHGSEDVREERRSFVRLVEEALDSVDQRVAKVWGKKNPNASIVAPSKDSPVTTCASVPIIDTPQPAGESSAGHSEAAGSAQGEAAPTLDDAPRVSRPDSDASTDVSTIIPSRAESNTNEASTFANDQAAEPSRDVASGENPSEDEPVSNILLARAEEDQGHLPVTEETARDDHDDDIQVPISSVNITEAPKDLDSTDAPIPSPTVSGSSHSEAIPGGALSLADEDMTDNDSHKVVVATGTSGSPVLALETTTAVDFFDVVYPDSSSSSIAGEGDDGVQGVVTHVSAEEDVGGETQSDGKQQVEDGFELL